MDDTLKDMPAEKACESPPESQSEGQIREASPEICLQKDKRDEGLATGILGIWQSNTRNLKLGCQVTTILKPL